MLRRPMRLLFFAATVGRPSFFVADSPDASTLFLGGEDDFHAAMPAATPVFAALGRFAAFLAALEMLVGAVCSQQQLELSVRVGRA